MPVTAREVLDELHAHVARCEALNQATTNAFASMSESHRVLASEMKKTRESVAERWDKLNNTAWKALGAIALTILAGIVGVAFQNMSIARTTAAAAAQATAPRDAADQQILKELRAIRQQTGTPQQP